VTQIKGYLSHVPNSKVKIDALPIVQQILDYIWYTYMHFSSQNEDKQNHIFLFSISNLHCSAQRPWNVILRFSPKWLTVSKVYLVKNRSILQILDVFPRKEDRKSVSLWEITNVWPPKRSKFCPFMKKLQTQFHCPQFICQMLPHCPIYSTLTTQYYSLSISTQWHIHTYTIYLC